MSDRLTQRRASSLRVGAAWAPAAILASALLCAAPLGSLAQGIDASQTPPTADPAAPERCTGCHALVVQKPVVHGAMQAADCRDCHAPVPSQPGKCGARTASHWALAKAAPDLCYDCHERKDKTKSVHTALRDGSCLDCHAAHASDHAGLLKAPREELCFGCHDAKALLPKSVRHAPVAEGRCLECHDPHGSDRPNALRAAQDRAACLRCHDVRAPSGKGTPGRSARLDLSKPNVHPALDAGECGACHETGHSGELPKLLKKRPVELCYECHDRKDGTPFPHGAVTLGDCTACHDPHASEQKKLLARKTDKELCFGCHQDDLTGRAVVHPPAADGCGDCHDPHGGKFPRALKGGAGKAVCEACHAPVDTGSVKHAALERYGCTACHDPHGSANAALLADRVNALCGSCHPDQQDGRHVAALSGPPHPVGGDLLDPRRPGRGFSCASCHAPHGSDNAKLFYVGKTPMQSCDGCHGDKSGEHPELQNVVSRARRKPGAPEPGAAPPSPSGAPR
ncbi:cytochrome c3 family protein [Anaeromyxobacter terrae]|uniref:cytochrome c3 family protein n=1 Tax=Anaeromyxobacter terrae TaxID=2925406 RepID=UPI001F5A88A1|nr:cytochrome c3 family protein [Anaeromyxobacter sp. SG22]